MEYKLSVMAGSLPLAINHGPHKMLIVGQHELKGQDIFISEDPTNKAVQKFQVIQHQFSSGNDREPLIPFNMLYIWATKMLKFGDVVRIWIISVHLKLCSDNIKHQFTFSQSCPAQIGLT